MNYRESDYRSMLFNVSILQKFDDPLVVWPELNRIDEFRNSETGQYLPKDKVIRYIFLCYDRGSPVVINNKDLIKRKYEAALLSGFELIDKKFQRQVEDVIKCQDPLVNEMICAFVRLFGDDDFAYITSLKDALYAILPSVQMGDIKDIDKVQKLKKEIDTVTDKILVRDNTNSLYLDLYKYIEREKLGLRPEDMALKNNRGR
jgi:hypothetical protein